MSPTRLRWGSATDVGLVRTNNEDQLLAAAPLFAVADGMGGHELGEVAAQTAIEALATAFVNDITPRGLALAVQMANHAVYERSETEGGGERRMGTTLTTAALVQDGGRDQIAVANVGDSRTYLLRDGALSQLTEDHNVPGELMRQGAISPDEAAVHPQRNIITRVLGTPGDVEVDLVQIDPRIGDRVLLASDGLFGEVDDEAIATILRRVPDPDEASAALVAAARNRGGADNITVVVVDVIDEEEAEAPSQVAGPRRRGGRRSAPADSTAFDEAVQAAVAAETQRTAPRPVVEPAAVVEEVVEAPVRDEPVELPRMQWWRPTPAGIAFIVALVLILGTAVGILSWYGQRAYHVGLDGVNVAVFKGKPGGFLWLEPKVVERTKLRTWELPESRFDDLQAGKQFSDLAGTEKYIENLREEAAEVAKRPAPPPTLKSPVTTAGPTTTAPPPTFRQ
jgi:PPM family protein phosphatase